MTAAHLQHQALHTPVLLREVVTALAPTDGGTYLDATFGNGGYTTAILEAAACAVIAIDRDGNITLPFNSEGMYRGSVRSGEQPQTAIYR